MVVVDHEHWYGKPEVGFRRLGTSLEPDRADLGSTYTPIDHFFVCTAGEPAVIDPDAWTLRIHGDAAARSVEVGMEELRQLEQVRVDAWLECAGNGRRLFGLLTDTPLEDSANNTPWLLSGMGQASWTGPRLSSVLALAGHDATTAFVGPVGHDRDNPEGEPIRMSLPVDKAMHPDTIVALTMNGEPLTTAHGAPARLLVPGWVGAYSVKWLAELEVSSTWIDSWRSNEYYVLRDETGHAIGPATAHPPKSHLCLDWAAQLAAGVREIEGYARCGVAPIETVEWALDDGPWETAELLDDLGRWAWRRFRFTVDLPPGHHVLRTRASAADGSRQPGEQPHHRDGVLWNAVIAHPIVVAPCDPAL